MYLQTLRYANIVQIQDIEVEYKESPSCPKAASHSGDEFPAAWRAQSEAEGSVGREIIEIYKSDG